MSETPRPTEPVPPHTAGRCVYCHREVWRGNTSGTGLLRAGEHPGSCCGCSAWLDDHPGEDPRERKGVNAEQVPAERAEQDPSWRDHPRRACRTVPAMVFEPDPDRDDPLAKDRDYRDVLRDARVHASTTHCRPCPVRYRCRAAAHLHGYEGLWGGVVFQRYRWTDLLSGEQGHTMYAGEGIRNRDAERARARVAA